MSHFTVLVVGDDVKGALQPFHEYECTGTIDQYVLDVDETESARKKHAESGDGVAFAQWAAAYYALEIVTDESQIDRHGAHKWGWILSRPDGTAQVIDRTNPNRKWDWWVIGGRWSNALVLKDGSTADSALMKDVDWRAMQDFSIAQDVKGYDAARKVIESTPESEPFETILARHGGNREPAITEYQAQERIKAWRQVTIDSGVISWREGPGDFMDPRDVFEAKKRAEWVPFFACLHNGKWTERGSMGWWGIVRDEKEAAAHKAEADAVLASIPPDARVTVVDCHI